MADNLFSLNLSPPPRVSVGMPVRNGERYLESSLDSLLAQDFDNFELIVSDNGSTDATEAICRAYSQRDRRIRYYRATTNLGAAWNYNRVAALARGELFRWATHDDLVAPNHLSRCVAALDQAGPQVVLCYPRTVSIDADGNRLPPHDDLLNLWMEEPARRFQAVLTNPGHWNPIFGLMRLSALRQTSLIRAYWASDTVLLAELSLLGKFLEIPEDLFFRRYHENTSYRANTTLEDLAVWMDPANKGKRRNALFGLRLYWEHLRAIHSAPLSMADRLQCYSVATVHGLTEWRSIAGDIKRVLGLNTRHLQ